MFSSTRHDLLIKIATIAPTKPLKYYREKETKQTIETLHTEPMCNCAVMTSKTKKEKLKGVYLLVNDFRSNCIHPNRNQFYSSKFGFSNLFCYSEKQANKQG